MTLGLNKIIGTIQVHTNGAVWMIPRNNEFGVLSDYLNTINNKESFNEQLQLIEKLKMVLELETIDQKWNCFENELGGMDWDENRNWEIDKKYGWISNINYQPNLLLDIETDEIFLCYLHNDVKDKFKINLNELECMTQNWLRLIQLCGSQTPIKPDNFEIRSEIRQMSDALNRYV